MVDALFFRPAVTPSLSDIAGLLDLPPPEVDPDWRVGGLASLAQAGPSDLSFCANARHGAALAGTRAGCCLLREQERPLAPSGTRVLVARHPAQAFARLGALLYPDALRPMQSGGAGAAPGLFVDQTARLEAGVKISAGVVIGHSVEIGAGTVLGPHVVVGDHVRIGRDCAIAAHVSIAHSLLGDRVIVHAGARLGQDGFGFVPGARGHAKVAQLGRVIVQDDVEVGANSAIDRGALEDTIIGEGTKIDNLVHIAHNVVVGRHCLIAAQTGIAGSTRLGDHVFVGGQAGLSGHLLIGRGAGIAGKSGVVRDVEAGARVAGAPAGPARAWLRRAVRAARAGDNQAERMGEGSGGGGNGNA